MLYIVSTPIGNLEDITFRAIRILNEVDLIVAEDTRRTKILLEKYNIKKKMISYNDYNKVARTKKIINELKNGKNIALVSDSGTPVIADIGFYLVREAINEGIEVIPIPGPCSIISAIIVSGLPCDKFIFQGWLPRQQGKRKNRLKEMINEEKTMIFLESPYRIGKTLNDMFEVFGDRKAVVVHELTKKFEEKDRGTLSQLAEKYSKSKLKGEFIIILDGKK